MVNVEISRIWNAASAEENRQKTSQLFHLNFRHCYPPSMFSQGSKNMYNRHDHNRDMSDYRSLWLFRT